MIYRLFLVVFSLLSFNSFANGEGSEQLFGNWTSFTVNGKLGKNSPWIWFGDVAVRSSTTHKDKNGNQSYDVGSIPSHWAFGYQFDKMNSLMLGYVYQYSQQPYAKKSTNENRIFEQYQNMLDFGDDGKLQNRTRFEQRWVTYSDEMGMRIRYKLGYVYSFDKDWSFSISDEVFLNINTVDWGPKSGFDQNRIFVGPVYQINKESKVEFGYMNNYVNKDLKSDQNNHIIAINYTYNIPD